MARDRIKSRASFRSENWTGGRGSAELGLVNVARPCSMNTDLRSLELTYRGESGFLMTERALFKSGSADGAITSGSPPGSSLMGETLAGHSPRSSQDDQSSR